mgnify:CR=1 FL=1
MSIPDLSSPTVQIGTPPLYFNRELSWITFNRRMLDESMVGQVPLLERVCRFAQASVQLDEYFMVRMAALKQAQAEASPDRSPDGLSPSRQMRLVRSAIVPLLHGQNAYFKGQLRPQLAAAGVTLLDVQGLTEAHRGQLQHRFEAEIAPMIAPLVTASGEDCPDFSNLSLHLAIAGSHHHTEQVIWLKVPRSLPRFLPLHTGAAHNRWQAVPLEQVIAAHVSALLPAFSIQGIYPFRVTRSAELDRIDIDDLESAAITLIERVQESLQQRHSQGQAVRLEVTRDMPAALRSRLMNSLGLTTTDVYRAPGWLGYRDLMELTMLPRPDLAEPPWVPALPPALVPTVMAQPMFAVAPEPLNLFGLLQTQDLLVHLPYHSFSATVEQFIAGAAQDPAVLGIKVTLYRTAGDVPIVRSLMDAAKAGKQIVVLVELTAALDEETNIHWARSLEKAGAHVVYGVVGLKTHTNLALVVRREGKRIRQYAYVGTGDYLPNRPQPYADLGLLTSHSALSTDLSHLFNFLTGYSRPSRYRCLMVAPGGLRSQLTALIQREVDHAKAGRAARLIAKLNVLADPDIINVLYQASQAGVQIDLMVRGVCCLRPGVPGLSDRIQVTSLLGRYVEHSRLVYVENGGDPQVWMGSVDWTQRGLDQRVEVLAPIHDAHVKATLIQLLHLWLADTRDSWQLAANGDYMRRVPTAQTPAFSVHDYLMQAAKSPQAAIAPLATPQNPSA